LRSKSERALNGEERHISPDTEAPVLRAQSWKDVSGKSRGSGPNARSGAVQYVGTEQIERNSPKERDEKVDSHTYKQYVSEVRECSTDVQEIQFIEIDTYLNGPVSTNPIISSFLMLGTISNNIMKGKKSTTLLIRG
jgi:hypothetical protein